jgi:UDP-N-acetylmuramoylalanine--D-glutamate ligase
MSSNIRDKFKNKKIVILGLGVEGTSTYKFLRDLLPETKLYVMDKNETHIKNWYDGLEDKLVEIYYGNDYLKFDVDVDYIFKSPGIPGFIIEEVPPDTIVTSQTNEFIEFFKDDIIGITGTKGKSTTSTLLYKMLLEYNVNVELVGNIGRPPFDYINNHEEGKIYVYELSSHQLEILNNSPHISIILNIFEEHLDHYSSYNKYIEAKLNIGKYQDDKDIFIYSCENEQLKSEITNIRYGEKYAFGEYSSNTLKANGIFICQDNIEIRQNDSREIIENINFKRMLLGKHNLYNIMCSLLVCKLIGIDNLDLAIKVISEFNGLEHRLEYVGKYNDIIFYNDSISTIPQSTICALESIENVKTLIVGGFDRQINYSELISYIKNKEDLNVIFLPTVGHRIYNIINEPSTQRYYKVEDLKQAVDVAFKITTKNSVCILSPAAASYTYFKNFEERGRVYKYLVRNSTNL